MFKATAYGKSQQGVRNSINSDSILCMPEQGMYAIADGFGKNEFGRSASQTLISMAATSWHLLDPSEDQVETGLHHIISKANSTILDQFKQMPVPPESAGTTATLLFMQDSKYWLAHTGDTRCYWITDNNIVCRTKDHTLVQQWIDEKRIHPEEAATHAKRNVLTQALGIAPNVVIDTHAFHIVKDGFLLLCTDGVHDVLSEAEIQNVVTHTKQLDEMVSLLLEKAFNRGSQDDLSAIIIKIREEIND